MKTRVIAGLCMAPLLAIIYFGGIPLAIAAALIAYLGVTEFFNGWEAIDVKPSKYIAYAMITLLYAGHFILGPDQTFILAWLFISITAAMIYGWDMNKRGPYDAMATVLGLVYVVFFSYHIVLLDYHFRMVTWLVVIAAFGSDIMAYFTGYLIGKHKLAPVLSPKKTIEGAIGGLVGAAFFCGLFAWFFLDRSMFINYIIIGFAGGAFSQAGDLTASAFKRKMGVKDYGHLIPGHGGIMDRFDSIIFVAPLVYYFIIFGIRISAIGW
ncbi:MAG: phosphatidate cytidylyltransferase [Clostridiales bacterium]|nr:phosphatidate cytidylyltransferase [Candidatus Crickella merdequi]